MPKLITIDGAPTSSRDPVVESPPPDSGPDAPNPEFTKKQVDLALSHIKDQMGKEKPELLDRLGWTKEDAQKFLDNMQKLKDAAQRPDKEGQTAKKAYDEFLKDLDLRPRGTQIHSGRTKDDLPNVRDSGQIEPPAEWAEPYREYSRSIGGQK